MFEFHGWAVISRDAYESDEAEDRRVLDLLQAEIAELEPICTAIHLDIGLNGMTTLQIAGLRNHRYPAILYLFNWIADHAPDSYGLLYLSDDEDYSRGTDSAGRFRVWRLAHGTVEEFPDPFLSPRIPTIKDPYKHSVSRATRALRRWARVLWR